QADMAARKECDIRRYMYLATLDMKTCAETCGKLDGRIFLVKDQKPGYNCPPMHPWCRCTTLAILSDEWIKTQTRRARDPKTGRTFKVPLSMTYGEWKKKYLDSDASKPKSGNKGKGNDIENYLRNNLPGKKNGFTDTRNVGEYISKQDLARIKEKAQSYGIRMGADEHSNGNFELYR
ncbi:MAG: minor capsid protein, partial [Lachnospira sp.]|nr:minor capsid protein [Lachnospira sp.]